MQIFFSLQKCSPQQSSYTKPHYRLSFRDVPFVAGTVVWKNINIWFSNWNNSVFSFKCFTSLKLPLTLVLPLQPGLQSVGCSHSVRANVQSVLSLLKQHQPHLCNSRVLSNSANSYDTGSCGHSDSESSSSNACGEDLSELLQALQEELRLMSLWVYASKVCK